MNSSNVVGMKPEAKSGAIPVCFGIIPALNFEYLSLVSPIVMPGMRELEAISMEGFTPNDILSRIYGGGLQLLVLYLDRTGTIKPDKYQERFVEILPKMESDYIGFTVINPLLKEGFHIHAVYFKQEYRNTGILQLFLDYLEAEARKMGSPYISLATRLDVSEGMSRLGYKAITVNYRKKLKE